MAAGRFAHAQLPGRNLRLNMTSSISDKQSPRYYRERYLHPARQIQPTPRLWQWLRDCTNRLQAGSHDAVRYTCSNSHKGSIAQQI